MILALPPHEIADVNALSVARADHERAGRALARAEQRMAAVIIRKLWGKAAVRLIVDKDINDDDETDIDLLVVLDAEGSPLWVNTLARVDCYDYPGAEKILNHRGHPIQDVDNEVVYTIELHLEAAYDATGGASQALDPITDPHFSSDHNLLEFDIDVALMTDDSPQRRISAVLKAVEACGAFAARHFGDRVDEITDAMLWSMAHAADAELFPGDLNDRRDKYEAPDESAVDDDWVDQLRSAYDRGRKKVNG